MSELFFELIRVSIGVQECLSRTPSIDEWDILYDMAKKQSLIGICFFGLQQLGADEDEGFSQIGMNEIQFFSWMGMAARILQRNVEVNRQCDELLAKLSADGLRSIILKGQGVGALYKIQYTGDRDEQEEVDLSLFRQSGDIDVWVNASMTEVVAWAEQNGGAISASYLHVGCRVFPNTEVELHYRPTYMRSLRYNRRVQAFCEAHKTKYEIRKGLIVPSYYFNIVYLLSHIYRHLFGLGIGMRQLMDYYFVLKTASQDMDVSSVVKTLKYLGLYRFAGAVMFVMREVFKLEEQYFICSVDVRRGRMLLDQVMQTGSFGHMDKAQKKARSTTIGSLKYKLKQLCQMALFYPEETLSTPVWYLINLFKHSIH